MGRAASAIFRLEQMWCFRSRQINRVGLRRWTSFLHPEEGRVKANIPAQVEPGARINPRTSLEEAVGKEARAMTSRSIFIPKPLSKDVCDSRRPWAEANETAWTEPNEKYWII